MTTTSATAVEPALSVRQVLALDRVLAGEPEVVAGAGQLDRPVRWVHVAEAPDVGVMLSGGTREDRLRRAELFKALVLDGLRAR